MAAKDQQQGIPDMSRGGPGGGTVVEETGQAASAPPPPPSTGGVMPPPNPDLVYDPNAQRQQYQMPQMGNSFGGYSDYQGPFTAEQVQRPTIDTPTIDYSQYQPHTREMSQEELVSGQLESLLESESPYMRQATPAAQRQAAQRGLLSSSMAVGASQAAAIQAALPIAAADAQAFQRLQSENAAAINNFNLAKLQSATNMAMTEMSSLTSLATATMDANTRMKTAAMSANAQTLINEMQIAAQRDALQFQAQHESLMEMQRQNGRVELAKLDYTMRDSLMRAGFQHDFDMSTLSQEQRIEIQNIAHEQSLAEIDFRGSVESYLQNDRINAGFNMSIIEGMMNYAGAIGMSETEWQNQPAAIQNMFSLFKIIFPDAFAGSSGEEGAGGG